MTQQALPLVIPEYERDYHAHDNWSSVLCRRCGQVLWHRIHSRTEGVFLPTPEHLTQDGSR